MRSIAPLGWHVFVEQPLAEAFAPLYASLQRTGLLLLAGLVLAVAGEPLLARRMVMPIRAIQAGAARIAAGKLDQRIDGANRRRAGGAWRAVQRHGAQLKESYAGLERKVEERTRELTESLEQQTATRGDPARSISSSPTDMQPVLESGRDARRRRRCDAPDCRPASIRQRRAATAVARIGASCWRSSDGCADRARAIGHRPRDHRRDSTVQHRRSARR